MEQGKYLLAAGVLMWSMVGILVVGLSLGVVLENDAIKIASVAAGVVGWVAAFLMAKKGADDFSAGPRRGGHGSHVHQG